MDIFAVCAAAVITAVLALMLRSQSPHSAMLLSAAAGVVIILSLVEVLPGTIGGVSAMLADAGLNSDDVAVLLKVIAICFVTEFTCDCVTEAGLMSLSTNISFAGKVLVLIAALPLFDNILSVIKRLSGAA